MKKAFMWGIELKMSTTRIKISCHELFLDSLLSPWFLVSLFLNLIVPASVWCWLKIHFYNFHFYLHSLTHSTLLLPLLLFLLACMYVSCVTRILRWMSPLYSSSWIILFSCCWFFLLANLALWSPKMPLLTSSQVELTHGQKGSWVKMVIFLLQPIWMTTLVLISPGDNDEGCISFGCGKKDSISKG